MNWALIFAGAGQLRLPDPTYRKLHLYEAFGYTESSLVRPAR
jgi:hypothetical protein